MKLGIRWRALAASAILAFFAAGCSGAVASPAPGSTMGPAPSSTGAIVASPGQTASEPPSSAPPGATVAWIAYQADDLRMIRPDGTGSHLALPDGPTNARHPDWSPDGLRFAFVTDEDDSRDIWVADWDGANARRVFDCEAPCFDADGPAWSPDGRSLVFRHYDQVDGACPGSILEVLDLGSGVTRTVATTRMPEYIVTPRWSNDGRSIVMDIDTYPPPVTCDSSVRSGSDIAVLDLDDPTLTLRRITDLTTFPSMPDWHPTEDLILFEAGTNDPFDLSAPPIQLYTVRPDGSELTQLTHFGPDDPVVWIPAWAPDGASILVTVTPRDDTGHTIGRLRRDGTGLEQLPGPVGGAHPRQRPVPGR